MQDIKLRLHPDLQRLSKAEANSINCKSARQQLLKIRQQPQAQQDLEEAEGEDSVQMEQHEEEEGEEEEDFVDCSEEEEDVGERGTEDKGESGTFAGDMPPGSSTGRGKAATP